MRRDELEFALSQLRKWQSPSPAAVGWGREPVREVVTGVYVIGLLARPAWRRCGPASPEQRGRTEGAGGAQTALPGRRRPSCWPGRALEFEGWARRVPGIGVVRGELFAGMPCRHNSVPGTSAGGAPIAMISGTSAGGD